MIIEEKARDRKWLFGSAGVVLFLGAIIFGFFGFGEHVPDNIGQILFHLALWMIPLAFIFGIIGIFKDEIKWPAYILVLITLGIICFVLFTMSIPEGNWPT